MFGFIKKISSAVALGGADDQIREVENYLNKNSVDREGLAAQSYMLVKVSLMKVFDLSLTDDILLSQYHSYDYHRIANEAKNELIKASTKGTREYYIGMLVCAAFSVLGAEVQTAERANLWKRIVNIWISGVGKEFHREYTWNLKSFPYKSKSPIIQQADGTTIHVRPAIPPSEKIEEAALAGNVWCQMILGARLFKKDSLIKTPQESINWFIKAYENGCPEAAFNLGLLFSNGEFVSPDFKRAIEWLSLSAEMGDGQALCVIECIQKNQKREY